MARDDVHMSVLHSSGLLFKTSRFTELFESRLPFRVYDKEGKRGGNLRDDNPPEKNGDVCLMTIRSLR